MAKIAKLSKLSFIIIGFTLITVTSLKLITNYQNDNYQDKQVLSQNVANAQP